jgi:hypothetical protein
MHAHCHQHAADSIPSTYYTCSGTREEGKYRKMEEHRSRVGLKKVDIAYDNGEEWRNSVFK